MKEECLQGATIDEVLRDSVPEVGILKMPTFCPETRQQGLPIVALALTTLAGEDLAQ